MLGVVYLLYNTGYWTAADPSLYQVRICEDAIRLARMVTRLLRHHPEPRALLAMMLLSSARASARIDAQGVFVPLHEQDRSLWDWARIREGLALVDGIYLARNPPGTYQLQAAISAIHCRARRAQDTDWKQIIALYEKLEILEQSPVVTLNRASAMLMAGDIDSALEQLGALDDSGQLKDYQPFHASYAFALRQGGLTDRSKEAHRRAIELSCSETERAYLEKQLRELG